MLARPPLERRGQKSGGARGERRPVVNGRGNVEGGRQGARQARGRRPHLCAHRLLARRQQCAHPLLHWAGAAAPVFTLNGVNGVLRVLVSSKYISSRTQPELGGLISAVSAITDAHQWCRERDLLAVAAHNRNSGGDGHPAIQGGLRARLCLEHIQPLDRGDGRRKGVDVAVYLAWRRATREDAYKTHSRDAPKCSRSGGAARRHREVACWTASTAAGTGGVSARGGRSAPRRSPPRRLLRSRAGSEGRGGERVQEVDGGGDSGEKASKVALERAERRGSRYLARVSAHPIDPPPCTL